MNTTKQFHPPLGTVGFYTTALESTHNGYAPGRYNNSVRICPRSTENASREVKLTDITVEDVVCWFSRERTAFVYVKHPNIRYDYRPEFLAKNPEAFQISRIQVDGDLTFEKTRQPMCMFCLEPHFFLLTGDSSLLFHFQHKHPQETPGFVKLIVDELGLSPEKQKHSVCEVSHARMALVRFSYWPGLTYLDDGDSNRLRFAPHPGISKNKMQLADVSEEVLTYWYARDIEDYQKYRHRNITYKLNPDFDPLKPCVYQISRSFSSQNGLRLDQIMCLYCQTPRFFYLLGEGGLLGHYATFHWPMELPSTETYLKAIHGVC